MDGNDKPALVHLGQWSSVIKLFLSRKSNDHRPMSEVLQLFELRILRNTINECILLAFRSSTFEVIIHILFYIRGSNILIILVALWNRKEKILILLTKKDYYPDIDFPELLFFEHTLNVPQVIDLNAMRSLSKLRLEIAKGKLIFMHVSFSRKWDVISDLKNYIYISSFSSLRSVKTI